MDFIFKLVKKIVFGNICLCRVACIYYVFKENYFFLYLEKKSFIQQKPCLVPSDKFEFCHSKSILNWQLFSALYCAIVLTNLCRVYYTYFSINILYYELPAFRDLFSCSGLIFLTRLECSFYQCSFHEFRWTLKVINYFAFYIDGCIAARRIKK